MATEWAYFTKNHLITCTIQHIPSACVKFGLNPNDEPEKVNNVSIRVSRTVTSHPHLCAVEGTEAHLLHHLNLLLCLTLHVLRCPTHTHTQQQTSLSCLLQQSVKSVWTHSLTWYLMDFRRLLLHLLPLLLSPVLLPERWRWGGTVSPWRPAFIKNTHTDGWSGELSHTDCSDTRVCFYTVPDPEWSDSVTDRLVTVFSGSDHTPKTLKHKHPV